ncbi:ABC transporter ATP-binding protein [Neobittarella massiliensis]|uniref:ABC transporter ATP-binding protein n=1 Tax=Neobittarella massiliensis (ex Bilen et al. 2018) TaxID=2041842 RepID=A0A8J6IQY5_9FIRM|nr:ABC transporter ATP-binding protein [Neobittarella massiliensis]MBC3517387.1 ABC transporter ATP-binding protein [Neobittarella massiliensis]
MDHVLKVEKLCKHIGKKAIVQDATFSVRAGEIMGFLGPNGAGKTTTIKMILGLLKIDSGRVRIGGYDAVRQPEQARESVGGIIENPEMYAYLSGRKNLQIYANMYPGITRARIDEVISMVKLGDRIDDKVRRYSLGMRQRLGVAQAIMHRPRLLILDEPTNGLDPMGIKELRDTLQLLARQEGVGVLISSHQLAEMELMCDRVCIIDGGKIIATRDLHADEDQQEQLHIAVKDPQQAAATCSRLLPDLAFTAEDGVLCTRCDHGRIPQLVATMVQAGLEIYAVTPHRDSLEDMFLQTTTGSKGQIQ